MADKVLTRKATAQIPVLQRQQTFERIKVDEEKRTVELSFSSEFPVERWFGTEILDHSNKKAMRLKRLNDGGALLSDHNRQAQCGVVEKAWYDEESKTCRAIVRFSKGELGEREFQDVKDGIRRNISFGYVIHAMRWEESEGDEDTYRATDWEAYEISIVSIPADPSVGIGRAEPDASLPRFEASVDIPSEREMKITDFARSFIRFNADKGGNPGGGGVEPPKVTITSEERQKAIQDAQEAESHRVSEILLLGSKHRCETEASAAVKDKKSLEEFRGWVLENKFNAKPVQASAEIGMEKKDLEKYSLVRAMNALANPENRRLREAAGLELEASAAVAKNIRKEPGGFFVPHDITNQAIRTLNVTTATQGGFLVNVNSGGQTMVELLRNKTKVVQLGATVIGGLVGNIAIPRVTGGATAYWLDEQEQLSASDQAFGQLTMTPRRLAAATAYTKQLLAQSSIDIESFVRSDLTRVIAIEKDRAAINGLNSDGEPMGILNDPAINATVTFGGAPVWADVVEFETGVADDNADDGSGFAFLTTPAVRGKWKTTLKDAVAGAGYLWSGDNTANGYRAEVSKNVPSNRVIFGAWPELVMGDWDGIDVVVDPYSLSLTNQVRIVMTIMTDNVIRQPLAFNASTDSGAQ